MTSSESSSGNSVPSASTSRRRHKRPSPVSTSLDTNVLTKDDIPSIVAAVMRALEPPASSESSGSTTGTAAQGGAQTSAAPLGISAVPSNREAKRTTNWRINDWRTATPTITWSVSIIGYIVFLIIIITVMNYVYSSYIHNSQCV